LPLGIDQHEFSNPSAEFRSVPFWSLNDILEPAEIERQLEEFKKGGFGGAYLHSRTGLLTEYLGDEWWAAMDAGVKAGERLGLEIWFYDEDKWPSGFAGGMVPLASEDFHARSLIRLDKPTPLPEGAKVLAEDDKYRYVEYKVPMGDPWFNGTCWVDLLNPETVKAFLELSYKPYVERYKDKIGEIVKGIFTDEPQVSPRVPEGIEIKGAVSYSPIIRDDFLKMHGYDFVDHIACLFDDVGDYRRVRLDYFRTIARRFEESFSKQIGSYCAETGLTLTGHYNGEEGPFTVQANVGNMMIQYRHMQRPGIDHLGLDINGALNAVRSLSSVANQYGQERRLSEMFGISGQNMNFEDRKWIADFHAVLGVNHVCPHLSLYSMRGCRKRDYPPTFSPHQPYWPYNKMVEDYMARMSYLSTVGKYAPEILVIHPLESNYTETSFGKLEGDPRRFDLLRVLESLQRGHRDYDLGDEEIMEDIGSVSGNEIRVGEMSYRAVVLPHMVTIRPNTLSLLKKFAEAGGPIISVGELPRYVDAVADEEALAWLRDSALCVSVDQLASTLEKVLEPAVKVEGNGSDDVWIHRRVLQATGGESTSTGQVVFLTNTSRFNTATCKVHLDFEGDATIWDPADGKVYTIEPQADGSLLVQLSPAQSLVLVTGHTGATPVISGAYSPMPEGNKVMELSGPWSGGRLQSDQRGNPNAMTLDFARYSTDGGKTFSQSEPVIGIHERFTETQYSGPLQLAFDVQVDQVPKQCSLVVEKPDMYDRITVNGQDVSFSGSSYYVDPAFRTADVTEFIKAGVNTIVLSLDYVAPQPTSLDQYARYGTEIESIYLIGEFAIAAQVSDIPPEETQRNRSGRLPQRPVHRFNSFSITAEKTEFGSDLALEGYPFFAGEFKLKRSFELTNLDPNKRYFLTFPCVEAIVIKATLNGVELPPIAWSPWEVEITEALREGENELELVLTNSLRNLLGPHHHREGELIEVGPSSFTGQPDWPTRGGGERNWYDLRMDNTASIWRDDYHVIPFGLLSPPVIEAR